MKFNSIYFRHLLGWALFIAYELQKEILDEDFQWKYINLTLSYLFVLAATFYLTYGVLCKRLLRLGTWKFVLIAIPVGIAFFIGLRYLVQEVIFPITLGYGNYYVKEFFFYVNDNIWRAMTPIVAGLIVFLLESRSTSEKERAILELEKQQAEMAFLRSQFNPHFLFNTLSFLHTEAFSVSEKLAGQILQLSDVLRYATESTKNEAMPLEEELTALRGFTDIHKYRFGDLCYVSLNVEGNASGLSIEPLLLIPFVENAFKHGVYTDPEQPIKIQAKVEDKVLNFECVNKIKAQEKDPGSGVGLENVRQRLELRYPGRHRLEVVEKENTFKVSLRIEL